MSIPNSQSQLGNKHFARAAVLAGFEPLVESVGLDANELLEEVGLSKECLQPQRVDDYLPVQKLEALFTLAEKHSGRFDIAASLGHQQELSPLLGVLGFVMLQSKSVGAALKQLQHYFSFQLQGAFLQINISGLYVVLSIVFQDPQRLPSIRHSSEYAIAAGITILKTLCGPNWRPNRVEFMHANPSQDRKLSTYFMRDVRFEQERSAIVFLATDLLRPIKAKSVHLETVLQTNLTFLEERYTNDFPSKIEQLIYQAMSSGDCRIERVCEFVGMHRRTLSRHLKLANTSYTDLVEKVRRNRAINILQQTSMSLTQISVLLCYSEPSAFSRAFRQWFGVTPREWRVRHSGKLKNKVNL